MALNRKNSAPAFETDEDQGVEIEVAQEVEQPRAQVEAQQPEGQKEVAQPATGLVAKPSAGGLALKGGKLTNPFKELEGVIDVETVKSFGVGTFPKVTADLGGAVIDKRELGKSIVIELISFNNRWVVTPGSDDDEAKELIKISYDGTTLEGEGLTAQEYVEQLKENGYNRAAIKKYIDLWATLISTENEGVIPDDEQEMVHIQLSPQSAGKFGAFQVNQGLLAARGVQPSAKIKVTQERGEWNSKKFGFFTFSKG